MSQTEKAAYFKALKAAGVTFDRHYREYSTEELKAAYDKLEQADALPEPPLPPIPQAETTITDVELDAEAAQFYGLPAPDTSRVPRKAADPQEMAGQRQNSQPEEEPIRVDEFGRLWYQEEVRKPAYPKPRGRRVLTYVDTGTKQQSIKVGDYVETFEVAGDEVARVSEVKITLPSYQVGVYKDPRFPFKVHTYNGLEGFDLFGVRDYYGGAELVPADIKRVYVENVLCYDIRTTVRAIQDEYRELVLAGKVEA